MTLIFTVLMGFSVLTGQYLVNASSALLYCVLATISGVFDIISCILYFQHSKYKLMDPKASSMALLAQLVFLTSPVSLFMSVGELRHLQRLQGPCAGVCASGRISGLR